MLAFNKKYQPQQEVLSAQLQGDLSSLYGLILFLLSHMFSNTVLIPCGDGFCKEPRFLIEGASKIALFPFCVWRRRGGEQSCNNRFICFENEKVGEKVNSRISCLFGDPVIFIIRCSSGNRSKIV